MATVGPPAVPGNNRVYLFRLLTLTIDEGTTLVRNIFDDKRPNVPLDVFLAQEKTAINRLRASKTITSVQYDLLFPQSGIAPKTGEFNLTLTVCLLRNLRVLGFNRQFKWNFLPQPGDISLEADLWRLQLYRNELAHISTTTGVSETDFNTKWGDIEKVLHRLNASVSNPVQNLQHIIDDCKTRPLDHVEQERIDEIIEKMQTRERELKTDLLVVRKGYEDLRKRMNYCNEIQKQIEENKYFKNRPDRYDHYLKLLFKGGRFVIVALIEENIKNQKKTLKDILQEKEDFVRKQIDNQDQLKILYPSDKASSSRDISTWDIRLLATVFLQVLVDESVDTDIKDEITEIDEAINFIATSQISYMKAFAAASDSEVFNDCYLLPLYCKIQYLAHFLNTENKEKWETIYRECTTKVKLPGSHQTNQGKSIKDEYEETLKKTRYVLQDMAKHNVAFKNEHVLELKMFTIGTGEENAHSVEDTLLRIWQEVLGIKFCPYEDFPNSRKELSRICKEIKKMKDVTYFHVTQPSVILGVASSAPCTVFNLLNYFESSAFNQGLSIISLELGLDIEAVITFESLKDIFNDEGSTKSYTHKHREEDSKLAKKEAEPYEARMEVEALKQEIRELRTSFSESYKYRLEEYLHKKKGFSEFYKYRLEEDLHKKKDLKEDLITLYRQQYHTLPMTPLIEEHDTPLLDFYVTPDINIIESQRSFHGQNKSKVTSLHDIFYKKNKLCREIYLEGDAGLGKTGLSKRLALMWCQAHKRNKDYTDCFEKEETDVMSEFEFVFLLSLRDCSEECDIDQMIRKQIIPFLAHKSNIIENVLSRDKCLVILDGLDEWNHPKLPCVYGQSNIPHRKARECTTIITTTKPWKLGALNLKSSQVDQKLELDGLSKKSSSKLKKKVITLLSQKATKQIDDQIKDFDNTVAEKGVADLESVPLLLMYLLCLWCDKIDLGRSKCLIYCQIVELLLKRTFKKYPAMHSTCLHSTTEIPQCFDVQTNCRENYTFLLSLGKLAFEALFSSIRENTLVFDRSLVDKYLKTEFLNLSLRSGIITQDKEVRLTGENQKTSFSHKTVHEFFAALYISTCSDQDKVLKEVLSSCNCVKNILDMSEVFIFISGINPRLFSFVSEKLMKVINEDEITRTYRSVTCPNYNKYVTPVKEIQDLLISCMKEIPENSDYKMCLQDLIFDKACQQENYYSNLQLLALQNKNNIKSIGIEIEGIRSLPEIITHCEFSDMSINCQKILYLGECKEAELIPLLSRSVKCVTIISSEWRDSHLIHKVSSWSRELSKTVQNNNQLQAININKFSFSHDVLEEFLNYLVNRKSMKEIRLYSLFCTDHGASCPGFKFDLSQHAELRCLGLGNIPLSQLNVNVSLLEECHVGNFSNSGIVTSYLSNISAASKLQTFTSSSLKSSDDIQTMLQTLSLLVTVKDVRMYNMNLGESLLPHEIVNIEYVWLLEVTMSSSSLIDLVFWIETLPQQVTVDMLDCKITPEEEFEEIKEIILTSEKLVVVYDGEMLYGRYQFKFRSIK